MTIPITNLAFIPKPFRFQKTEKDPRRSVRPERGAGKVVFTRPTRDQQAPQG